jgi:hypothetical protein
MKLAVISPLLFVLASVLANCEPVDESPPPATPNGSPGPPPSPPPPPPSPPPAATDPTGAATASEPGPTSAEYTIGEDTDSYDDNDPAALKDFHAALDPVGTWADDPKYGTVWQPSAAAVGADFTPYATAGHWAYDDDWVWVSDYPWGWAPFHYGRWILIGGSGWAWVPGRAYRGAWVSWGVNDGYTYLGWAPMPPAFFWFGGVAVGWGGYIGPSWVYCPRGAIFSPAVGGRVVSGAAAAPIAAGMRTYVPATPGVSAGPSPQKMGFGEAQIPRPTGKAASSITQAQAFARPSTGQALGASNPTRLAAPSVSATASRPSFVSPRPSITAAPRQAEATARSAATGGERNPAAVAPHTALPAARSSGWYGGGGAGVGGGGHHR